MTYFLIYENLQASVCAYAWVSVSVCLCVCLCLTIYIASYKTLNKTLTKLRSDSNGTLRDLHTLSQPMKKKNCKTAATGMMRSTSFPAIPSLFRRNCCEKSVRTKYRYTDSVTT